MPPLGGGKTPLSPPPALRTPLNKHNLNDSATSIISKYQSTSFQSSMIGLSKNLSSSSFSPFFSFSSSFSMISPLLSKKKFLAKCYIVFLILTYAANFSSHNCKIPCAWLVSQKIRTYPGLSSKATGQSSEDKEQISKDKDRLETSP